MDLKKKMVRFGSPRRLMKTRSDTNIKYPKSILKPPHKIGEDDSRTIRKEDLPYLPDDEEDRTNSKERIHKITHREIEETFCDINDMVEYINTLRKEAKEVRNSYLKNKKEYEELDVFVGSMEDEMEKETCHSNMKENKRKFDLLVKGIRQSTERFEAVQNILKKQKEQIRDVMGK